MIDGGQEPLSQEPLVVNEEFDLSDIMGEQLDSRLGSKEDRLRQIQEQVGCHDLLVLDCSVCHIAECNCKLVVKVHQCLNSMLAPQSAGSS